MEQLDALLGKRKNFINNRGICALAGGLLAYNTYMTYTTGSPVIYPLVMLSFTAISVYLAFRAHRNIRKIDAEISLLAQAHAEETHQT